MAEHPLVGELDAEDAKLVTLARAARARTGAPAGAAVRDGTGRTYVAVSVTLEALTLSALEAAVVAAVGSGATTLEAAAVVGEDPSGRRGTAAVRELAPVAPVYLAAADGSVFAVDD